MSKESSETKKITRAGKIKNVLLSVVSALAVFTGVVNATPYIASEINKPRTTEIELAKDNEFGRILSSETYRDKSWNLVGNEIGYEHTLNPYHDESLFSKNITSARLPKPNEVNKPIVVKNYFIPRIIGQEIEIGNENFIIYYNKFLKRDSNDFDTKIGYTDEVSTNELKKAILSSSEILVLFPGLSNTSGSVDYLLANNWLGEAKKSRVIIEIPANNQTSNAEDLGNVFNLTFKDYYKFARLLSTLGGKEVLQNKGFILVGTSYGATQSIELANRLERLNIKPRNILLFSPLLQLGPNSSLPSNPLKPTTYFWGIPALRGENPNNYYPDLSVLGRIPTQIIAGEKDELIDPGILKELKSKNPRISVVIFPNEGHSLKDVIKDNGDRTEYEFLKKTIKAL